MPQSLDGKIAWITGAGSGIGEAAALSLAGAGAQVILTGRRREPLDDLARRIETSGGKAMALPGDLTQSQAVNSIIEKILTGAGRLDILINNAGGNIPNRKWDQLTPAAIDQMLAMNLNGAFYCAAAALRPMRAQKSGQLIHTGSWAARFWSTLGGACYTAAKAAINGMSHAINLEEYRNGIRSTVVMPAEVATPILDKRPVPPPPEARAVMLQPADMGELFLFLATRPASVCINEIVISPTANRLY